MRKLLSTRGLAALSLTALSSVAGPALAQAVVKPAAGVDATELEPVTVLATRTATRVDEAPATVSVITDRQIEAMLATDIKDLVRYEPGVSVPTQPARFGAALGTAGRAGAEGFVIRGLGGDRVLTVIDGVRSPDGFVFGAQSVGRGGYADLDLMKSVEILRGPASALYGSDGVAGAVAFVTKDPADVLTNGGDFAARARVGYNSADEGLTTAALIAGRRGALSGLVGWTGRDSSETDNQGRASGEEERLVTIGAVTAPGYDYSLRTLPNPQDIRSDAWLAKLVWDVAPGHSLRLTFDDYTMDMDARVLSGRSARFTSTPPTFSTAVLDLTAADRTERRRLALDWRFNDALGMERGQVSLYGQEAKTRQFTFEDRVGADRTRDNTFDNDVAGVAADGVKALGAHRLTFGFDHSKTTQQGIRDGTVPPFGETFPTRAFPKTDYTLTGVFIQDEIALMGGDLRLVPALRWDRYALKAERDALYPGAVADQSDNHISPKLGLVWRAGRIVSLFANWGEGFKAPTPSQVNNYFSNPAFGYVSQPNPDLRPETSRSLEAGLRLHQLDMGGGLASAQLVIFRSDYDDFISQQVVSGAFTPSDPAVYQFVNFSEVKVNGLEAKADIGWDNGLRLRVAAAYAQGEISDPAGGERRLDTIDPVKVVGGLGWDHPAGRFGGEAIITWSGGKDRSDTENLSCFSSAAGCAVNDAFTLLDVTAYWNVSDRVTARAGLFNVFDETYSWWSDLRGVAGASPVRDAYTQPGRNFGLSLALRY